MRCASALATYVCSNVSGTTCTKAAVTIPIFSTATVCAPTDLVVVTGAEWSVAAAYTSPFDLLPADGGRVALAVLLVWAAGWSFRMLIRAMRSDESVHSSET